jgi:hypothetical protein
VDLQALSYVQVQPRSLDIQVLFFFPYAALSIIRATKRPKNPRPKNLLAGTIVGAGAVEPLIHQEAYTKSKGVGSSNSWKKERFGKLSKRISAFTQHLYPARFLEAVKASKKSRCGP